MKTKTTKKELFAEANGFDEKDPILDKYNEETGDLDISQEERMKLAGIYKHSKPNFSVTIKTNHDTYEGEGETAVEALRSIPKPFKVMWRATVTVKSGEKKIETLMYPVRLKRLFYNKMFQEIMMNKLTLFMK